MMAGLFRHKYHGRSMLKPIDILRSNRTSLACGTEPPKPIRPPHYLFPFFAFVTSSTLESPGIEFCRNAMNGFSTKYPC